METTQKFKADLDLLRKYNRPGPRYTSYPTAPHFHGGFGPDAFRSEILETNQPDDLGDLSLYFHFPFCRTLCHFCACNVIITHNPKRIQQYLDYVKKEIALISEMVNPKRKVIQMHWGGGTPTYLTPEQIRDVSNFIHDHFNFAADAEISMEIDPRRLTPEHLPTIRDVGFNRVSFGVQDLNAQVQQIINRIQPYEQNEYVITESQRLNYDSINVDLIYGLPYQTTASYAETLDQIIGLSPDRLAVFNYAHVPWLKKHQKLLPEDAMPNAAERLKILELIINRLTDAGYVYIGMDHFAKPDDELTIAMQERSLYRNFQGYSTHSQAEVYAMGVTSISQLNNAYAQNTKTTKEYERMLDEGKLPTVLGYKLTRDDQIRRHVITELMCNNRILKKDVENRFQVDFDQYFLDIPAKLEEYLLDGLLVLEADRIEVNEAGRLVIRNIAMAFDAFLKTEEAPEKPIFSRTV